MNYQDQQRQQHFMAQRMVQQGQRMPMQMQQQNSMPNMMQQQQPNMQRQTQQSNPHLVAQYSMQNQQPNMPGGPAQQMHRLIMPSQAGQQGQMAAGAGGQMYQQSEADLQMQQANRDILTQQRQHNIQQQQRMSDYNQILSEEERQQIQMQIQAEPDIERKKMIMQNVMRKKHHQQQMRIFEQQQQMGGGGPAAPAAGGANLPGAVNTSMHMTMHQRMAAQHQQSSSPHSMLYNQPGQQQQQAAMQPGSGIPGQNQQQQMNVQSVHIQRIPSQSAFNNSPDGMSAMMGGGQSGGQAQTGQPMMPGSGQHLQAGQPGGMPGFAPGGQSGRPEQMGQQQQMSQQYLQQFQQQQQQFQQQQYQQHQASNQGLVPSSAVSQGPHSHHSTQGNSPMPPQPPSNQAGPPSNASLSQMGGPGGPGSVGGIPRSGVGSHYVGSPSVQGGVVGRPPSVGAPASNTAPNAATPASARPNTPASKSVLSVQPQSVPAPTSVDQNAPDYKATLVRLKSYQEACKRLIARIKIDKAGGILINPKLETSLERVLEIMEGKRVVNMELIERLIKNVKSALNTHHQSKHLLEIVNKLAKISSAPAQIPPTQPSEGAGVILQHSVLPDVWQEVRHLQIKVPEIVAQLVQTKEQEAKSNPSMKSIPIKRKLTGVNEEDGPPAKKNILATLAASFSSLPNLPKKSIKLEDGLENPDLEITVKVECLNGGSIRLSKSASLELCQLSLPYSFDPDFMPISESCPQVHLLVTYRSTNQVGSSSTKSLSNSTLRLLLPVDYPDSPIQLCQDTSSCQEDSVFDELKLQLDLGSKALFSLTQIISCWSQLMEQFLKQKRSHPAGQLESSLGHTPPIYSH